MFYLDNSMFGDLKAAGVVPGFPKVVTSAGYPADEAKGKGRSNGWTETDFQMLVKCCEEMLGRFPLVRAPPSRSGIFSGPRSFLGSNALC